MALSHTAIKITYADGTLYFPRSTFVNPVIIIPRWYREKP